MGKLDGKVAVILGASSIEGLGGVIAKSYANEGAKVVISGRRQEPLDELAMELSGKAQVCDITVDGDIENLFKVRSNLLERRSSFEIRSCLYRSHKLSFIFR